MSTLTQTWTEWLKSSRFSYMTEIQKEQTLKWLFLVRDKVLKRAEIKQGDVLIDIGTGTGLLAFEAYNILNGSGKVIASDYAKDCIDECRKIAESCHITQGMEFLLLDSSSMNLEDDYVDVVVMRSVLVHVLNKAKAIKEFYRILKPGGRISIFEPIIKSNTRYYELINPLNFPNYEKLKETEYKMMTDENDPLVNFDNESLIRDFEIAGFREIDLDLSTEKSTYQVSANMIDPWFNTPSGAGNLTMKERFLKYLTMEEVDNYIQDLKQELDGKVITLNSLSAYISAKKV